MSGSPVVQRQPHCSVTRECESVFTGGCQGPPPPAETGERAEQQPRMELNNQREDSSVGNGPRMRARQACVEKRRRCENTSESALQGIIHHTPVRPFITICPPVLFHPWQKPPLTFRLDSRGICFLQYDVSRHPWPQLSRMPVSREKGISAVPCRALGHSLLGAFILMPHTKLMPNTAM